jgi:sec-independent protein translocase protein TatB
MPGFQELVVIALVALLAVGPDRLPKVARDGARILARFRQEARAVMSDLKAEADAEGFGGELRQLRRDIGDPRRAVVRSLSEPPEAPQGGSVHSERSESAEPGPPPDRSSPADGPESRAG